VLDWYSRSVEKIKKNWYDIQLIDELVVGSFEPPDARAARDRIRRPFANGSYFLKLW
jgi:hypothetical protein